MICEQNKHINKETEIIKRNQTEILELKSTMNKVKNSLEMCNSRLEQAGERTANLKLGQLKVLNMRTEILKK